MFAGLMVGLWLLPEPRKIGTVTFDVHTLLYSAIAVLLGFQAIAFAVFTKLFAISEGLLPPDPLLDRIFRYVNLELGLLLGTILLMVGLGMSVFAVKVWSAQHFGPLDVSHTLRTVIPAAMFLTLGVQTIFSSFFLSVLGLHRR